MVEPIYSLIGSIIRRERENISASQEDLGKYIGHTRASISNIEAGKQRLDTLTLLKIIEGLAADQDEILNELQEGNRVVMKKKPDTSFINILQSQSDSLKRLVEAAITYGKAASKSAFTTTSAYQLQIAALKYYKFTRKRKKIEKGSKV